MGWRGPTGIQGPQGIERPGYDSVTGPPGPPGDAGAGMPLTATIYTLSDYVRSAGVATPPVNNSNLSTLWTAAIPEDSRGKSGALSLYFDMTLNYLDQGTEFDYGLFIDDAPLALGPDSTQRYKQTQVSSNLVGRNGVSLGAIAPTPLYPLSIPVTMSSTAGTLQLKVRNVTTSLDTYVASSSSNVFTTVGSNAYTTPVGSVGVLGYVWGCGGSPFGSNAGGPGGFSFGYYPCTAGTVLTAIVGGLGTNTFLSGFGGPGGSGTSGAGGGFSGLFLGASPTSNLSTPLLVAGGGGGCFIGAAGPGFRWVGGGGGGLNGVSSFNLTTLAFRVDGTGNGASQVGGGYGGSRWSPYFYNGNGAGGGGYYGGGGGTATQSGAGGGGSGYIDAAVLKPYRPPGRVAQTEVSVGSASQITAPGDTIMRDLGYSPGTYAHGGGGTGLIILIPVTGTSPPLIGVDARFSTT
jgi:hypothetical protein